jgi:3-(3-hydroxy-phenyl)propionate hydroxylase
MPATSRSDSDDRVIVVGAGPVGLIVALELARHDISVTVLEKEPALAIDLRAGSFHPPSLEIMSKSGVTRMMHEIGIPVREWQLRDLHEGVIAQFDLGLLKNDTPYPYRLHCEQWKMAHIAAEVLSQWDNAQVLFSHPVVGIDQDEDGVTVVADTAEGQETFHGRYAIAADGGRSMVRKLLGLSFDGFTWPAALVVASTTHDFAQYGFTENAYIADPDYWCAIFRMPGSVPRNAPPLDFPAQGLWRFAYGIDPDLSDEEALHPDAVEARMQLFQPKDGRYDVAYRSTYRVHQRVVDRFRVGRILLAGDAAHINSPMGALGLNSGIQDAGNLTSKIIPVWRGETDESALDLYDRQRRTIANDFVQAWSIRNQKLLQERDPQVRRRNRDEMRAIAEDPQRAHEFLLNTSMIASIRRAAEIA